MGKISGSGRLNLMAGRSESEGHSDVDDWESLYCEISHEPHFGCVACQYRRASTIIVADRLRASARDDHLSPFGRILVDIAAARHP